MKVDNKNNILSTNKLSVGYANLELVKGININVSSGKLISILGKNGSGKSTLLRTLTQLQNPLKGSISFFGKEINEYKTNELAPIFSLVLTEKIPENLLTVYEIISMGRHSYTNWLHQLSKKDQKIIDFAIEKTHINELLKKKLMLLSDGQRQRVLLAKAIAQDTPLLFLDEPTAHLDIHHRMETFLLLKKLAHSFDKTIIMATHEVGLSTQLADEMWLLNNQLLEIGSPKELITNKKIAKVFDSDLIRFNSKTSTFEFKK